MDLTNMLNSKGPNGVHVKADKYVHQLAQVNTNLRAANSYPSPSELQQPMSRMGYGERPYDNLYGQSQGYDQHRLTGQGSPTDDEVSPASGNAKTFPCATCAKGFARRSDLARHERIHSGDRPHVCPEEGCGKPFIQRSALTVHMRVHSGEKPHMCERCGKPFSDSSSLARHRRIHSGKRPYKCPFADCQKTFTRRTTLTRHQNHHKGTVEEAAVATAAALASRAPGLGHTRSASDAGYESSGSMASGASQASLSPGERNLSISPSSEIPQMPNLNRQTSNLSYTSNDSSLPPHLRGGLQQPSPRSSPSASSPSLSAFGSSNNNNNNNNSYHRPSLTSHPTLPVLEPKTYHDFRQPGSGSGSPHLNGSPHLSASWPSPIHPSMPSPGPSDFAYPELPMGMGTPGMSALHYPVSNLRRPQSTEPDHYELPRPRLHSSGGAIWTGGA